MQLHCKFHFEPVLKVRKNTACTKLCCRQVYEKVGFNIIKSSNLIYDVYRIQKEHIETPPPATFFISMCTPRQYSFTKVKNKMQLAVYLIFLFVVTFVDGNSITIKNSGKGPITVGFFRNPGDYQPGFTADPMIHVASEISCHDRFRPCLQDSSDGFILIQNQKFSEKKFNSKQNFNVLS
jgi:hypothetical protein